MAWHMPPLSSAPLTALREPAAHCRAEVPEGESRLATKAAAAALQQRYLGTLFITTHACTIGKARALIVGQFRSAAPEATFP